MSASVLSIVIINGSVRAGNYTTMASALVADELRKDPAISVEVVDPATLDLPWPGLRPDAPDAKRLRELVSQAAGVVLATPEYHGSFSSAMKLVIENLGFPSTIADSRGLSTVGSAAEVPQRPAFGHAPPPPTAQIGPARRSSPSTAMGSWRW